MRGGAGAVPRTAGDVNANPVDVTALCAVFKVNVPARAACSVIMSLHGGFVRLTPVGDGRIRVEAAAAAGGRWSETVDGVYDVVVTLQMAGLAPGAGGGWAPAFTAVEGRVAELVRRGYEVSTAHGSGSSATARRDGAAIEILADDAGRVVARCEDVEQVGVDVLDVVEHVEERLAKRT